MPRAIIIGADGFLGRNLSRRLEVLGGWTVHNIGKSAGDLSLPGVAETALAAAPKADRIFHVVTRQRTGQVQYGIQAELLAINTRIHLAILEAWYLHQPQAKLVSAGSSCAYPESEAPLTEAMFGTGTAHPSVKGYALAKQVLVMGAQTYAEQYGLKHLHCILATMYGPMDHKASDRSHFVGAMLERAAAKKLGGDDQFEVWGDPAAVREVLYVDDQIDAILAADLHFENRHLNTAADLPIAVQDVAQSVLEALDWDADLVTATNSFSGANFKVLDSSTFLSKTGWRPSISLPMGLRLLANLEYPAALRS